MPPECKQCGRQIVTRVETVHHNEHTYFLHKGGCPSGYDSWEPTRKTPR